MNARKYLLYGVLLIGAIGSVIACSKQEDSYADFIKDGEIIYTARVDSLNFAPGRNRARLNWALTADQRITKVRVFWNDRKDSLTLPIQRSPGIDYMEVLLSSLAEKVHTFEIKTYDDAGHSSMIVDTIITVYGDIYQSTLFNRPIKTVTWKKPSTVIEWSGANAANVRVEGTYIDTFDLPRSFIVPKDSTKVTLLALKKGTSFTYRTAYLPHPKCLDTFFMTNGTWLVP